MSPRPPVHALDAVAQRWRTLAERRHAHFVELYDSGRWKHYFTEAQFRYRMREAIAQRERWARIAPRPEDEVLKQARSAAEEVRRTAA